MGMKKSNLLLLLLRSSYSVGVGRKECRPYLLGAGSDHSTERVGACSAQFGGWSYPYFKYTVTLLDPQEGWWEESQLLSIAHR